MQSKPRRDRPLVSGFPRKNTLCVMLIREFALKLFIRKNTNISLKVNKGEKYVVIIIMKK